MRHVLVAVLATLLFGTHAVAANAESRPWLPVTKSDIVRIVTDGLHKTPQHVELMALAPVQRTGLASDDAAWLVSDPTLSFTVFMAGKGENIHSLHVYFPVVNNSAVQNDAGMHILSSLFRRIYPSWPEAKNWPQDSLKASWDASPLVTKVTPGNSNDLIVRKVMDGITSSTVGVPPDLVVYSITTREQCVPDIARGNPFRRVVC